MKSNTIWVTWEYQVRNRNLSKELGVTLYEINYDKHSRLLRYFFCIGQTIKILLQVKPKIVIHQSPSIVLAFLLSLLKDIFKYRVIIDTHNAGVKPAEGTSKLLNWLAHFSLKRADLIILHNEMIAAQLPKSISVERLILADPLPSVLKEQRLESNKGDVFTVVFVCRWASDEPYQEVIRAAQILESEKANVKIICTGRYPKHIKKEKLPKNIELSGFVSVEEYDLILKKAHCVLALTTRQDSLNCAAYEGMAYEKPTILSKSALLERFFSKGFSHTLNNAGSISNTIIAVMKDYVKLKHDIIICKASYSIEYGAKVKELSGKLENEF